MYRGVIYGASDKGRVRDGNEDYFVIEKDLGLLILCDGVGGQNAGEVASELCAQRLRGALAKHYNEIQKYRVDPNPKDRHRLAQILQAAFQEANQAVLALSKEGTPHEGLATTAEVVLLLSDYALLGHVGDSRTYLSRGGAVHQLTEDHKFGVEMIRKGEWDQATAARSPYRNTLTRAIGSQPVVQPDVLEIELAADDVFLLCSDGFSDYFRSAEIQQLLARGAAPELPLRLIEAANAKGGKDNITTLVAKVEPEGAPRVSHAIDAIMKQEAIAKLPLFAYLSFPEVTKILAIATPRQLKADELLFREGDAAQDMFVVVQGSFEVRKGAERLATVRPGAPIGEMCVFDQLTRSATVVACEPTTVLAISRANLMELLRRDSAIAVKFLWAMAQELDRRLRSTSNDLAEARKLIAGSKSREAPFPIEETGSVPRAP